MPEEPKRPIEFLGGAANPLPFFFFFQSTAELQYVSMLKTQSRQRA